MKTMRVMLAFGVLLALILSAHASAQFISIPIIGETTGKAIEGNPAMVITGTPENGEPFEYDAIPTIPHPMGIRVDVTLYNLSIRPEADATLGVAVGVGGWLSYDEWRARAAAEKSYSEKTRGELRRAHLGSIDNPGRWITAIRTGEVEFRKQKAGQNGPLMFTAYIEPTDLRPGINTLIVRVHGILSQRTTQFLILGRDGKSIFGTYDEPWLIMVGGGVAKDEAKDDECADCQNGPVGPTSTGYITPQELQFALNDLKEEIRAMLASSTQPVEQTPTPVPNPTPTMPDTIGISFDLADGSTISKSQTVNAVFDRDLPADSHIWFAINANGQWWPWAEVATSYVKNGRAAFSFSSDRIRPGPCALTVAVRDANGNTLGFAQVNLEVR